MSSMNVYRINVNDLLEEEIDYELNIRSQSTTVPLESKQRNLRALLREDENPDVFQESAYTLATDTIHVPRRLKEIEQALVSGRGNSFLSRLVHYHKRIRRYLPENAEQSSSQEFLLSEINRLAGQYFWVDFRELSKSVPVFHVLPIAVGKSQSQSCESGATSHGPICDVSKPRPDPNASARAPLSVTNPFLEHPVLGSLIEELEENAVDGMISPQPNVNLPIVDGPLFRNSCIPKPTRPSEVFSTTNPARMSEVFQPPMTLTSSPIVGHTSPPGVVNPVTIDPQSGNTPSRTPMFRPCPLPASAPGPISRPRLELVAGPSSRPVFEVTPEATSLLHPGVEPPIPHLSEPVNDRVNRNDYVPVVEIENYVKTYIERMLGGATRHPMLTEAAVDNLAHEISNIGLQRPERPRSSTEGPTTNSSMLPELAPPLQLSSQARSQPDVSLPRARNDYRINTDGFTISPYLTNLPNRNGNDSAQVHASEPINQFRGNATNFNQAYYPRRLPHQQCNIIEKWPKFSGDTNLVPVTDFLRQIDILCRSYAISKQELRMHAHLLFKDHAAIWYTTYEEKFDTWETLEGYLRMRYDNPNRDRTIREELRNRKQRPNELFSAYLTDIETLAQRLIRKMNEREKFDLIVENMKLSYKRRLALTPICSIEHLAQLCFKFDALESNLYSAGGNSKPSVYQIAVEDEDDEQDSSNNEPIYAIQSYPKRKTDFKATDGFTKNPVPDTSTRYTCWNCRETGHMWRDCDRRKCVFCHICGNAGTTAFQCPNKHNLRTRDEEVKEKND